MTYWIVSAYLVIGSVAAPFLMLALGLARRRPWPVVLLIWLLVALCWPFALLDLFLFVERPK